MNLHDNIAKLRFEITTDPLPRGYAGMTDDQVVASMGVMDRPGPFAPKEITKLLAYLNKMDAAERIAPLLASFDDIDYENPAHLQAITNGLDWLIGKGEIIESDKAAVLGLNQNRRTRPQEIDIPGKVKPGHVGAARA